MEFFVVSAKPAFTRKPYFVKLVKLVKHAFAQILFFVFPKLAKLK